MFLIEYMFFFLKTNRSIPLKGHFFPYTDRLLAAPFLVACFSLLQLSATSARRHGVSVFDLSLDRFAPEICSIVMFLGSMFLISRWKEN